MCSEEWKKTHVVVKSVGDRNQNGKYSTEKYDISVCIISVCVLTITFHVSNMYENSVYIL